MSAFFAQAMPAGRFSSRSHDGLVALGASLLFLLFCGAMGFPSLADADGDNDSLMRLVEVRDLLAGQGWFDRMQYRMGPEGGILMHWSRLVDLPFAMLIVASRMVTGDGALAETVTLIAWPIGLFGLSLYLILRLARALGEEWSVLPAAVIGSLTLYFLNIFTPGALDHHNVQLVLTLALILFLVRARDFAAGAPVAGACAAGMLAVGMETSPYVAVAGASVALLFLAGDSKDARIAAGFGAAFALGTTLAFMATVPARSWFVEQCDTLSLPQTSIALIGGGGLAFTASLAMLRATQTRRLAALAMLAAAMAGLVLLAFPQCLADPYAGLDPRLHLYWLDFVSETQSAVTLLTENPAKFTGYFITPLLGLAALGWQMGSTGVRRSPALFAVFLAAAILVSFWQVRGAIFSLPIAAVALSSFVGAARERAARDGSARRQITMALSWMISVNMVWQFAAATMVVAAGETTDKQREKIDASQCYANADYTRLAGMPTGTVLAVSNLGSSILRNTPHRSLSGSYHRNGEGNLLALDIWMNNPQAAEAVARAAVVDYVVLCRGNPETEALQGWARQGTLSVMLSGPGLSWLDIVEPSRGESLEIYRVRK